METLYLMRSVFLAVLVLFTVPVFSNCGNCRNCLNLFENSNEICLETLISSMRAVSFTGSDNDTIPSWLKGKFTDDYRITYSISDSLWMQLPNTRFHIIRWNLQEQYLLAKNDTANP